MSPHGCKNFWWEFFRIFKRNFKFFNFENYFLEPHTYINSAAVCSNAYRSEFEEVKNSYTNNVRDSQDALARFAAKMEKKLRNEDGTIE